MHIGCSNLQIDNREFTVTGAVDSLTARRIDAAEARCRHIIVDDGTGPMSPSRVRSPTSPRNRGLQSPGRDNSPGRSSHDEDRTDYEYYLNEATGERIPLLKAIDAGWVFVEYEDDQQNVPPDTQVLSCLLTSSSSSSSLSSSSGDLYCTDYINIITPHRDVLLRCHLSLTEIFTSLSFFLSRMKVKRTL